MKIQQLHIGTDHGGFQVKEELKSWLAERVESDGGVVEDHGAKEFQSDDDYPRFGHMVAKTVNAAQESEDKNPSVFGLLLCRSGSGMAIVANRYPHVRAVVCRSVGDARHAREHNNANVVVLEGDFVTNDEARAIIQTFFDTPFGGGRHVRRVKQLTRPEKDA